MKRIVAWSRFSVLLVGLLPACGSDGGGSASTSDVVQSCVAWCNKAGSCGTTIPQGTDTCTDWCTNEVKSYPASSCDYAKVKSTLDGCVSAGCTNIVECGGQVQSACTNTASGSGGSANAGSGGDTSGSGGAVSGSGGETSATGGSTGTTTGTCADCAKAATCCAGIAAASGQTAQCSTFSQATCEGEPAASQAQFASICAGVVQGGAAQHISGCD